MRLLIATLALLVLAPAALGAIPKSAKLTPKGLGGLKVGISEAQAEQVVGKNLKLQGDPACQVASLPKRAYAIFAGGKLRRVSVTSDDWATRAGVRVGDDEEAIVEAYPTAKRTKHKYVDGFYYKVKKGKHKLVFETEQGEITAISGGAKPEVDYIEACS